MLSGIRKRVTYTNVAMTLALVFAMTGGAYAAGKVLITSTKQIKPSVLAQLKGKTGANGAAGAQGPTGAAGAQGAAGPQGAAGAVGAEGPAGPVGGTGPKGANGKNGEPWTAGGTLPVGSTETGSWSYGPIAQTSAPGSSLHVPVASFAIPLKSELSSQNVHYINMNKKEEIENENGELEEVTPQHCPGSASAPEADSGNLCVYAAAITKAITTSQSICSAGLPACELPPGVGVGAGKTGAYEQFTVLSSQISEGHGTWAVTG